MCKYTQMILGLFRLVFRLQPQHTYAFFRSCTHMQHL